MKSELIKVAVFFILMVSIFGTLYVVEKRGYDKGVATAIGCVVDLQDRSGTSASELEIWVYSCADAKPLTGASCKNQK